MTRTFPIVNQLSSPTTDGRPDENAGDNCIPASLAAALQDQLGRSLSPDTLKDAVYGQGYRGKQAIKNYVLYCEQQGASLVPQSGTPAGLVSAAHDAARRRVPCLVTIPSNGRPPADRLQPGPTHVLCLFDDTPGSLVSMNPWRGRIESHADSWWADRLCFGKLWTVTRKETATEMQGSMVDGFDQLGKGFQQYVTDHKTTGAVIVPETYDASVLPAGESFAVIDSGPVLHYKVGAGVDDTSAPALLARFYGQIKTLQKQVADLQSQVDAASQHGSVEALQLVRDIQRAIKALPA
jgi:hypothetical protein